MDEEDDRKRMSTPDDERSSDSGFRDKESCEEEESPLPGPLPKLASVSQPDSAEEEQLRILFELDTILDAECYSTLGESLEQHQKPDFATFSQVGKDMFLSSLVEITKTFIIRELIL